MDLFPEKAKKQENDRNIIKKNRGPKRFGTKRPIEKIDFKWEKLNWRNEDL